MTISVFDVFKIGVGPSSSHTMGPMKAACDFVTGLGEAGTLSGVGRLRAELFGSLAMTGRGHCSDRAVVLGFAGMLPDTIDPDAIDKTLERIVATGILSVAGRHDVAFDSERDVVFRMEESLPAHPNGMRFAALAPDGASLAEADYYSIGGGFIARGGDTAAHPDEEEGVSVPYPFDSAARLLALCEEHRLRIDELVLANEVAWREESATLERLDEIWEAMRSCVDRGAHSDGVLPGVLQVRRRAPRLFAQLHARPSGDPFLPMDYVNAWALAVNEENAAGGRVVTAPTNGAAGIVPAVLHYFARFEAGADRAGVHRFLLTAAAIGMLYKLNASISGAEMGCQGEVGVACSMAAGGLVAALGGSNDTVEQAAEIGMEHNLGLTCDPVGGLVQIPCIERNAMGAVKAINAARIAAQSDGDHKVTLDQVIETMRQTGADMGSTYKETSKGGLAVNVIEC